MTETLKKMGLDVDVVKVKKAIEEVYPAGTEDIGNQGLIIRDLFRFFKSKQSD